MTRMRLLLLAALLLLLPVLAGAVVDQSALHGILKKVRDLGMPLLAVNLVGSEPEDLLTGDL